MLTLSRRPGESFIIGDPANPIGRIHFMEVRGDKTRVAFEGFTGIEINRHELAKQKLDQRSQHTIPTRKDSA